MLTFSIVLCTRNRAELLRGALESILAIDYPADRFELVVIDNASTDATPEVVRACAPRASFSVRYVFEERPGLSIARNRGIREALGQYLFFTDDDELVDRAILREHERVARAYGARAAQGARELQFVAGRPEWLHGGLAETLGETPALPEGPADVALYGANMCLRRDLFDSFAGFREDLGKGAAGYSEDTELAHRLHAAGEAIVYAPTAKIYHVIGPDRATPQFFRRNSFEKGWSHARVGGGNGRLGVAVRAMVDATLLGVKAAGFTVIRDRHRAVLAQSRAAFNLGRAVAVVGGTASRWEGTGGR
jgi:glucosyl-dolichyl phosphate glucuronosyltransferase